MYYNIIIAYTIIQEKVEGEKVQMLTLNRKKYLDKLYACWVGKNIGGTVGAPFEGNRKFLNIQGFTTPKGEPYPNDDLDLQLVWLKALEEVGAKHLTANVLAEYWLETIAPHYNEYGIAKNNLSLGLLPPMSGEVDNDKWKTSNGAWIRSEIWAGVTPGVSNVAMKYAMMDAMVDHGLAEGTYAEIFTVTLQSAAYVENNIQKLLDLSLEKIPADCAIAQTVCLVRDCYHTGVDYKETRDKVVEFNKDLGWFQAPAHIGFVVIGLLYGEGDFKKSMLCAVNCGDDTDCTAATVGATMGIINGMKGIPKDWQDFIGDSIVTLCINGSYNARIPKTCTELAERVASLVPEIMKVNHVDFEFTDEEEQIAAEDLQEYNNLTSEAFFNVSPYSYDIDYHRTVKVKVELDQTPRVRTGEVRKVKLTFTTETACESRKLQMRLILPESWESSYYERTIALDYPQPLHKIYGNASTEFSVTAGEIVLPVNRIYAEITCPSIPYPIMVPINFIG